MVQLPVLLSVTVADETPLVIDEVPTVHGPVALKLTSKPFATPLDSAVAETTGGCEPPSVTELGKEPRTMVWSFVRTAGAEGALVPGVGSIGTGSREVDIV